MWPGAPLAGQPQLSWPTQFRKVVCSLMSLDGSWMKVQPAALATAQLATQLARESLYHAKWQPALHVIFAQPPRSFVQQ